MQETLFDDTGLAFVPQMFNEAYNASPWIGQSSTSFPSPASTDSAEQTNDQIDAAAPARKRPRIHHDATTPPLSIPFRPAPVSEFVCFLSFL